MRHSFRVSYRLRALSTHTKNDEKADQEKSIPLVNICV